MRILATILFFALAIFGVIAALRNNATLGLTTAPLAPLAASSTILTGTIDYTRNNVGTPVPYLVYQQGGASTKELVFDEGSSCMSAQGAYPCALIKDALAAYYPGKVRVSGEVEAQALVVFSLAPA